jgi:hypothetical protein
VAQNEAPHGIWGTRQARLLARLSIAYHLARRFRHEITYPGGRRCCRSRAGCMRRSRFCDIFGRAISTTPGHHHHGSTYLKQQGAQWKTEHRRTIRTFKDALVPFQSGSVTSAQAHALTAASQAMLVAPLPACADPKGYYTQVMANLATTGQAASGGGTLSEVGALAPMEDALTALNELRAEMKQTIGSGKI